MAKSKINVPVEVDLQAYVDTQIRKAIIEAIGDDPALIVKAVVDQAMKEKDNRGYPRQTIFQSACDKMIRETAKEVFAAWIKKKRPAIRKALLARLNLEENGFVETIVDKIADGVASSFSVHISFKVDD